MPLCRYAICFPISVWWPIYAVNECEVNVVSSRWKNRNTLIFCLVNQTLECINKGQCRSFKSDISDKMTISSSIIHAFLLLCVTS